MLEFSTRPDRHGPALYFITDGSSGSMTDMRRLADELAASLSDTASIVLLDGAQREGVEVIDFYDIPSLPAALIIMDNDQVYQGWYTSIPSTERIRHMFSQAGGR